MVTQAMKKAQAKGIPTDELYQLATQRGLYGLSERIGCGIDAARTMADKDLGIPNCPVWTTNDTRTIEVIKHDLTREILEAYVELKTQYDEVVVELEDYEAKEKNREQIMKNEYIKMLNEVKTMRREVKDRKAPIFNKRQICVDNIDY